MTTLTTTVAASPGARACAAADASLRLQFHVSLAAVAVLFAYRVFIPRLPTIDLGLHHLAILAEALVLLALAVLAAVRLPRVLQSGGWIERGMVAYATLAAVSCLWTPSPIFTLAVAGKLGVAIVLTADAAQRAASPRDLRWVLYAAGIGIALHALLPWLGLLAPSTVHFHHTGRLMHLWISPTNWSVLAASAGLLSLMAADRATASRRWWWLIGTLFCVVTVWLSMGKTGLVALPMAVVVYAVLAARRKVVLEFTLMMALVAAPLLAMYPPLRHYWLLYLGNPHYLVTLSGRTLLWTSLSPTADLDAVANQVGFRPPPPPEDQVDQRVRVDHSILDLDPSLSWLLGHGYTSMRQVGVQATGHFWVSGNAHNAYLGVLFETGALGLLLVLGLLTGAARCLWRRLRQTVDADERRLAAEVGALLALLLVAAVFMDLFGGMPRAESMLVWPVLAIAARLGLPGASRGRRERVSPPPAAELREPDEATPGLPSWAISAANDGGSRALTVNGDSVP